MTFQSGDLIDDWLSWLRKPCRIVSRACLLKRCYSRANLMQKKSGERLKTPSSKAAPFLWKGGLVYLFKPRLPHLEWELDALTGRHVSTILNNVDSLRETCFPLLLLSPRIVSVVMACLQHLSNNGNFSFPRQQYSAWINTLFPLYFYSAVVEIIDTDFLFVAQEW